MKKTVYAALLLVFAAIFAFSAWKLAQTLISYREGQDSYQKLEQYVSFGKPMIYDKITEFDGLNPTTEFVWPSDCPQVDFEYLAQINPDVVGWIYIKDTNINYPIVQGKDNEYYLRRLFDGGYNAAGCIFLDAACAPDFSDNHSIIYGHHMRDKSMFAHVTNYKKQAFYEEHSEGFLITPDAIYRIAFFSGYVSDNWSDSWELGFQEISYETWLQSIQQRSNFVAADTPVAEDRVLTLSTCSYEFDGAKYVLHGYVAETMKLH